jgi:hypothetical protein
METWKPFGRFNVGISDLDYVSDDHKPVPDNVDHERASSFAKMYCNALELPALILSHASSSAAPLRAVLLPVLGAAPLLALPLLAAQLALRPRPGRLHLLQAAQGVGFLAGTALCCPRRLYLRFAATDDLLSRRPI